MPFTRTDPAPDLRRSQGAFLLDLMALRPLTDLEREKIFREPPYGTVARRWLIYQRRYVARITAPPAGEAAAEHDTGQDHQG